jgi:predicted nucleotidyltransferase
MNSREMAGETGYIALFKKRKAEKEKLRESALKEAGRLSAFLREHFEFDALYLIGSVVKGKGFHFHSDIDLVIKGLKKEFFLKALALLIRSSAFPVDLKPWEELDPESRKRVEEEGRILL